MTKFKSFVFIAAMVLTLLGMGKMTTAAQANNADTITTTPTGTPTIDPSGQGEPVSAEQQEELKAVIQSYFDIRYQALSNKQPYGFRPDGFGDLISDGADAKAF
jgi:hypothetical protein